MLLLDFCSRRVFFFFLRFLQEFPVGMSPGFPFVVFQAVFSRIFTRNSVLVFLQEFFSEIPLGLYFVNSFRIPFGFRSLEIIPRVFFNIPPEMHSRNSNWNSYYRFYLIGIPTWNCMNCLHYSESPKIKGFCYPSPQFILYSQDMEGTSTKILGILTILFTQIFQLVWWFLLGV